MREYKRYSREEDNIILTEVRKSPENIRLGLLIAASRIFQAPHLLMGSFEEGFNSKEFHKIKNRWYLSLSVKNAEVSKPTCYYLHSSTNTFRNRKTQRIDSRSRIVKIHTPPQAHQRFSIALEEYLKNR